MPPRRARASGNGASAEERALALTQEIYQENLVLSERLGELELALEDVGWLRLSWESDQEFSREGLRIITRLARLMYLKNPLIRRAALLLRVYTWGQGATIGCRDAEINAVVQAFLDDPSNRGVIGDALALAERDKDLRLDGNLFFVLFLNRTNGRVQVRTIDFQEIDDIIRNPEDRNEPRYYKRVWSRSELRPDGTVASEMRTTYYPDIGFFRSSDIADRIGEHEVRRDEPILHIRTGGTSGMRFGVSEMYPALDWARAVNADLSDYATVKRVLARLAATVFTKGGKAGVAAVKSKLGTTIAKSGTTTAEENPPPGTGALAIFAEGAGRVEPLRTAGAQPTSDDGRALRLMVAAATGVPETMLMGDADVGNLATAKTLDRPTELAVMERRMMWTSIIRQLCDFAIRAAAEAPTPRLRGLVWKLDPDVGYVRLDVADAARDVSVDVTFPPMLVRDELARVNALISAATLDGKRPVNAIPEKVLVRMLLDAVSAPDIDEILDVLYPDGAQDGALEIPEPAAPPEFPGAAGVPGESPSREDVAAVARQLAAIARRVLERGEQKDREHEIMQTAAAVRMAQATEAAAAQRARDDRGVLERIATALGFMASRPPAAPPNVVIQAPPPAKVDVHNETPAPAPRARTQHVKRDADGWTITEREDDR